MRTKYLLRRIGGFILATLLLSGMAVLFSNTAQAQRRVYPRVVVVRPIRPIRPFYPFGYPYARYNYYSQYVFSSSTAAENQGYKDGLKTGSKDGQKRKSYDPERSHYYQDAGFGNFAEAYRDGFARGYQNGYRGYLG